MDDMDAEAEELGGKRKFFSGDYERYGWKKLMAPGLGGFEVLTLYTDAIQKMNINPNIPKLFRDIFKNAYLPYRDPETLKSFLKIIDDFEYDHSERLGDAFEYLLSVLGSQGDAGQFRTPRHIIDFMVEIISPKKNETILDPACGTAGFLISSYKHIIKQNSSNYTPEDEKESSDQTVSSVAELVSSSIAKYSGDKLTPDERKKLAQNIKGYDISPDMVRLSLVNLYLHGFNDPKIYEYDTLTSEDNWNEYADVILANPPFMSPKGGIKPHKRFSIQSNRSEVLFVDYIIEHLTPHGRATIIVPEGVIFQSGKAYKQLRKTLVENYLFAVVSLPAGVFNPYSGVKTSILLIDKSLNKKTDKILFAKIENDGFDLGAQRRRNNKSELPQTLKAINEYVQNIHSGNENSTDQNKNILVASKSIIAVNGEWNLSGERYKSQKTSLSKVKIVTIGEIASVEYGYTTSAKESGDMRFVRITDINKRGELRKDEIKFIDYDKNSSKFILNKEDILVARTGATFGKTMIFDEDYKAAFASFLIRINFDKQVILPRYYYFFAQSDLYWEQANSLVTGGGQPQFNGNALKQIKVPLPPLEVQKEIVAEIEGYQKIIDGARQVVENYKPQIQIDPSWEMVELGEVCEFKRGPFGGSIKKEIFVEDGFAVYEQSHAIANDFSKVRYFISEEYFNEMKIFELKPNDLIMSCSGTMGKIAIVPAGIKPGIINQALLKLTPLQNIEKEYLKHILESNFFQTALKSYVYGAAIQNVTSVKILKQIKIPLPSLEDQYKVVSRIREELSIIASNEQLISIFEQKIKDKIASVWGE